MIFSLLRAGVSFLPSFINSLNFEMMALEAKSIRMIDSLTSRSGTVSALPHCPPGSLVASGAASTWFELSMCEVLEDERQRGIVLLLFRSSGLVVTNHNLPKGKS